MITALIALGALGVGWLIGQIQAYISVGRRW